MVGNSIKFDEHTEKPETMQVQHKQEYNIHDVSTRSVTLFPSRAHATREIKDVTIKPGVNQITITGLTPTLDEQSIKIEGTGSAIITDIAVELLRNRDVFLDRYPDLDDDCDEFDREVESEPVTNVEGQDNDDLKTVQGKLCHLGDEQNRAYEVVQSARSRLEILNSYGGSLATGKGEDLMVGEIRGHDIVKELDNLRNEKQRLDKFASKELARAYESRAKAQKIKSGEKETQRRAKEKY